MKSLEENNLSSDSFLYSVLLPRLGSVHGLVESQHELKERFLAISKNSNSSDSGHEKQVYEMQMLSQVLEWLSLAGTQSE